MSAQTPKISLSADSVTLGEVCTMTVVFDENTNPKILVNSGDWAQATFFRDVREVFSFGEKKYQILLSFYETPVCTIPPISFLFNSENGQDTVKTQPFVIRVPSVLEKLDSNKIEKLLKLGVPKPMKAGKMPILQIVIILLILIAAIILAIYFIGRYFKKKNAQIIIVPPFEEAMNALIKLDGEDLINKGEYKTFVFSLSAIFKRFVSRRYDVLIEEATSTEFKQWARRSGDLSRENKILVEKFINDTDPVKFADLTPSVENLRELRVKVEEFIKITRPIENLSPTENGQK
ncbi:MAG: hypothetical protein FWF51_08550 [Chitinivibrionia bacterium]|nr:hypothetical protein [Chitinivibrionia bacterium]